MWRRSELKSQAKQNLTNKYWQAFAVMFITGILASGNGIVSYSFNMRDFRQGNGNFNDMFNGQWRDFFSRFSQGDFPMGWAGGFVFVMLLFAVLAGLAGVAYAIFVSPVVQVGSDRWFSRSRESAAVPSIGMLFSHFKQGRYMKTVGGMLWMNLFLFLWSLLAMIPLLGGVTWVIIQFLGENLGWSGYAIPDQFYNWLGGFEAARLTFFLLLMLASSLLALPVIIKGYSYRMTPWILADNPQIGYKRALKLSIQLTRGHKWGIFVLDLSFIGWFILGGLLCGIGIMFVMPYFQAVQAELYARLRRLGVDQVLCTMEELGFSPVAPVSSAAEPAAGRELEP